jgi:hypothetical protein
MALVFGSTVVGCDDGTTKTTYYYEAYQITMAQCDSFISSVPSDTNYTFSQVQEFRQILRTYEGTFIKSDSGISESELKNFVNQHGIGDSEYTQMKNAMDFVGNGIFFFAESASSPYAIWMYVEKENV